LNRYVSKYDKIHEILYHHIYETSTVNSIFISFREIKNIKPKRPQKQLTI
jgi:hypothetical protein